MKKIITVENLSTIVNFLKNENKKIILVGGCFDILHPAHEEFLEKSKQLGDKLIVMLESNETIAKLKGEGRPINDQKKRAEALAYLSTVDYVILLPRLKSDPEYFNLVKSIKPDIIAITENDPIKSIKVKQAESVGGKVVEVMERQKAHSTSKMIRNLL